MGGKKSRVSSEVKYYTCSKTYSALLPIPYILLVLR